MAYGTSTQGFGPITKCELVVPHATNTFVLGECRALYVGTAGAVACRMAGMTVDIILPLGVGWHPLCMNSVRIAGTTATNMVAGY
jgi:hypothetical protein